MGFYIDNQGNYYEGDKTEYSHLDVPQRPSIEHIWENDMWVIDEAAKRTATKKQAIDAIQAILDAKAKELGFDSIHTAAVWQTSKNPDRAARAIALVEWGDSVWDFTEAEWANQEAGTPTFTDVETFLGALPEFVEPA